MEDLVFSADFSAIAAFAKNLGQKEIIVAKNFSNAVELQSMKKKAAAENLSCKFCHLVSQAEEKSLHDFENKADFFAVLGNSIAANKFAVSSKKIDFLLLPANSQQLDFDSAIANLAAANNVSIAILFSGFLNASQHDLSSMLRNAFLVAKICNSAKAKILVFSGASNAVDMRAAADLQSFLALLQQKEFDEENN